MSKQWWFGLITGFVILGMANSWATYFVACFAFICGASIVFHITLKNYQNSIDNLLEVKARQKMHIRNFIDVYDRLVDEGKIVILDEDIAPKELRAKVQKKRKDT